jgi:seryl-tRNA synthetase
LAEAGDVRELLLARDALVCGKCGNLRSVCSDPEVDWHPHIDTCYASATTEWGARRLQDRYKADAEDGALHPLDGVVIYPSQSAPDLGADPFA